MATTQNFGLQKFAAEGRISDQGYAFSYSDREVIDRLLYKLYNHDHAAEGVVNTLNSPTTRPTLTLASTGGTLPASTDLYYAVSFLDTSGNETQVTSASYLRTPDPIASPDAPTLQTATTGGTLEPGTYRYALAATQGSLITRAVNEKSIQVPTGTSTNTVTITYPTLPTGADGWKIYRRAPSEDVFYFLATVASGPSTYVDDGSVTADCTTLRPTKNTTNSTNSVTVAISSQDLPLSTQVGSWRVYRANSTAFGATSLLRTVTETTTQGGSDLITSITDTGTVTIAGSPRQQTSVPPAIPQIDAATAFSSSSSRLPATLQPQAVQQFYTWLNGTLVGSTTYNQFYIPNDMLIERVEAFFGTAPSTVDGSNYVTIRVKDDSLVSEQQTIYNDATTQNEIQAVYTNATGGTFTLSFDGQGPTNAIAYNALASTIKTELELLSNITTVSVAGSGISSDPWLIEFQNPGDQNVALMTANSTSLVGGSANVSVSIEGSDGGTFTLTDGTDTTSAIAYNAAAATIETRLETDITSITAVTVTGTGTSADPWVVDWVTPANTNVDLLQANDGSLNGITTITETVRGRGNTVIDLDVQTATQYHFWQSPTTDSGTFEAEDAAGATSVSDSLASNDVAAELDAQNETVTWPVGTLDAGTYTFKFYVSDHDQASTFDVKVVDANGPTTLASQSVSSNRLGYLPAFELEATLTGTEDIELTVQKTDATTNRVRVDRFTYEAQFPTLYQGQTGTIEVLVTGTPGGNGADVHVNIWY